MEIEEEIEPRKSSRSNVLVIRFRVVFWRLLISHARPTGGSLASFPREKLEIGSGAVHGNELCPLFSRLPVVRELAGQDSIGYEYVYTLSLSRNRSPTP